MLQCSNINSHMIFDKKSLISLKGENVIFWNQPQD